MQEFNKGIYDYIIATDESNETIGADSDDESEGEAAEADPANDDADDERESSRISLNLHN